MLNIAMVEIVDMNGVPNGMLQCPTHPPRPSNSTWLSRSYSYGYWNIARVDTVDTAETGCGCGQSQAVLMVPSNPPPEQERLSRWFSRSYGHGYGNGRVATVETVDTGDSGGGGGQSAEISGGMLNVRSSAINCAFLQNRKYAFSLQ